MSIRSISENIYYGTSSATWCILSYGAAGVGAALSCSVALVPGAIMGIAGVAFSIARIAKYCFDYQQIKKDEANVKWWGRTCAFFAAGTWVVSVYFAPALVHFSSWALQAKIFVCGWVPFFISGTIGALKRDDVRYRKEELEKRHICQII